MTTMITIMIMIVSVVVICNGSSGAIDNGNDSIGDCITDNDGGGRSVNNDNKDNIIDSVSIRVNGDYIITVMMDNGGCDDNKKSHYQM